MAADTDRTNQFLFSLKQTNTFKPKLRFGTAYVNNLHRAKQRRVWGCDVPHMSVAIYTFWRYEPEDIQVFVEGCACAWIFRGAVPR